MTPPEDQDQPPPQESPAAPRRSRSERREQAACDALRTFIRDLHMSRFGAVRAKSGDIDLVLRLKARPEGEWELQFEPSLGEQLVPQMEDAQAGWGVFRHGRVYCFRCDSAECEHALPASPLCVFDGYAPNGLPEWKELAQVLVEEKVERVDRLFRGAPGIVAYVRGGKDLRERQLSSFGRASKTYSVLGQVVAGYFQASSAPANGNGGASRVAVTFQAVEVREEGGGMRLRLNTLARLPDGQEVSDMLLSDWEPELYRASETARRSVEEIEYNASMARRRGDTEEARECLRNIPRVLRRLAESVERGYRQRGRRTKHVEQRRREQRPVHKALDDAREAQPEHLFFDEKTRTTIACGPQGRAHAFSADGRHVTSFVLGSGAAEFRVRTGRWRALGKDEIGDFRRHIEQRATPGADGGNFAAPA